MYYRRKILLALLDTFGGQLSKLELQKLLFLFMQQREEKLYSFVPYKYGCYSFQSNADLSTMQKYGQVIGDNKTWRKLDKLDYRKEINNSDRIIISQLYARFKDTAPLEITKFTYRNFPYYAIKSTIVHKLLNTEEQKKVAQAVPATDEQALYTIGYEGISIEDYLNKLIKNDIKVLCDVRRNPISMKYGFSKNQLSGFCKALDIKYIHFPNLGIESNKRKSLNVQEDYDILFDEYKSTILSTNVSDQRDIVELIDTELRVAVTCFETNIHQCHRFHLANSLQNFNGRDFKVIHI
jgi:uncharacterized protein (DUF488 family)